MLFLDLQKDFNTVDHKILIGKLKALGFRESSLSWLTSYLTDTKRVTKVRGVHGGQF